MLALKCSPEENGLETGVLGLSVYFCKTALVYVCIGGVLLVVSFIRKLFKL
jgi:hypothetical protein